MNILIVEEDQSTRLLLESWLREWGHHVTTNKKGKEAWELIKESDFGLVLSNWHLSGLDVLDSCRAIRKHPDTAYHYIILYSTRTEELDFVAGMDAGADDVISIPLDAGRLRVRLRAAERIMTLHSKLAEQNETLRSLNDALEVTFRGIQSDLQAAAALQVSLLPTVSEIHPSFCLDWLLLPSKFLAGDNLNYFMIQERYLVFYHLDVSGHGITSALLAVTLNHLLSPHPGSPMVRFDTNLDIKRIVPPVEVVSELNRRFLPQGDTYFTMIYGVLDTETRELRFCQAGHPRPLKLGKEGTVTTIGDGGFPVGLWPDITYDETITHLLPGERLIIYSDGVLECANSDGVKYSVERLEQLLTASPASTTKEMLGAVRSDLEGWGSQNWFSDDISLLIIESK